MVVTGPERKTSLCKTTTIATDHHQSPPVAPKGLRSVSDGAKLSTAEPSQTLATKPAVQNSVRRPQAMATPKSGVEDAVSPYNRRSCLPNPSAGRIKASKTISSKKDSWAWECQLWLINPRALSFTTLGANCLLSRIRILAVRLSNPLPAVGWFGALPGCRRTGGCMHDFVGLAKTGPPATQPRK